MKRTVLVFGAIAGLIVSAFMAISMALMSSASGGSDHGSGAMLIGYTSMIVAFAFVFVGIKNYRDKQNGGIITFVKGFWLGFLISFIASTMYVITWAIEFHVFLPDFMDKYAAMQVKEVQSSGLSGPAYDEAIKSIEGTAYEYKHNPLVFTMYTYLEILPVGILISLISALILKRKSPAGA